MPYIATRKTERSLAKVIEPYINADDIKRTTHCSDMEAAFFTQQDGIFKGYHISRGNWVSVLLDGTVSLETVYSLIDISFRVTLNKK